MRFSSSESTGSNQHSKQLIRSVQRYLQTKPKEANDTSEADYGRRRGHLRASNAPPHGETSTILSAPESIFSGGVDASIAANFPNWGGRRRGH